MIKQSELTPFLLPRQYRVFNCRKITKPMTLKFSDLKLVFINCFVEGG